MEKLILILCKFGSRITVHLMDRYMMTLDLQTLKQEIRYSQHKLIAVGIK